MAQLENCALCGGTPHQVAGGFSCLNLDCICSLIFVAPETWNEAQKRIQDGRKKDFEAGRQVGSNNPRGWSRSNPSDFFNEYFTAEQQKSDSKHE